MRRSRVIASARAAFSCAALIFAAGATAAQRPATSDSSDEGGPAMPAAPLGISDSRFGSGTSWLPDATYHGGVMEMTGTWALMAHGSVFLDYVAVSGTRSAGQLNSVNWVMVSAEHSLGGGLLRLRTMVSAEPLTIPEPGYPQLLQVASVYQGQTISDRQPPEAPVMELAALFQRALGSGAGFEAYVAPVGEPALGPVSYSHRPSAAADPLAPLSHFLQDITHVSYGVITAGVFTREWKLEGSLFNSAHPDPSRDYAYDVRLDGYSARLFWNPAASWSFSSWAGHLAASSGAHAHDASTRLGASALYASPRGSQRAWTTSLIWGAEVPTAGGRMLNSVLAEARVAAGAWELFARGEWVQRTPAQLALIGAVPPVSDVGALTAGGARRVLRLGALETWLGAAGTLTIVSADLEPFYGGQSLWSGLVYVAVRLNDAPDVK